MKIKNLFRDPLSIVLVVVIVLALTAAGLLAGELYARNRADDIVARVVECVVQDQASASFGALPPFLLQPDQAEYEAFAGEARRLLGVAAFTVAWEAGRQAQCDDLLCQAAGVVR